MTKKPLFKDKAKLLYIKFIGYTTNGNSKYSVIVERIDSKYFDTIELYTQPNSDIAIKNYELGGIYNIEYTRKGKSWDFVLLSINNVKNENTNEN